MKILIVFDSYFGNTEKVARAMEKALQSKSEVKAVRVGDVKSEDLKDLDVLIVGSPTRAFRPTKATSDFIGKMAADALKDVIVAAFDTGISNEDTPSKVLIFMVKRFGYAAKPLADKLVKKGGKLVLPPTEFWVKDTEGPLRDGELERAADWAKKIL